MKTINNIPIEVDFNNTDTDYAVRLHLPVTIESIGTQGLKFEKGKKILMTDGEVEQIGTLEFRNGIWVAIPDKNGIKIVDQDSPYNIKNLSKDTKMDDENGNCKKCGHPFDPHIIIADTNDFSKDGKMSCPVSECDCFHTITFNFNEE